MEKSPIWVAEVPAQGRNIGFYLLPKVVGTIIEAMYGGSIVCKIDLETGKLLKEEFVW